MHARFEPRVWFTCILPLYIQRCIYTVYTRIYTPCFPDTCILPIIQIAAIFAIAGEPRASDSCHRPLECLASARVRRPRCVFCRIVAERRRTSPSSSAPFAHRLALAGPCATGGPPAGLWCLEADAASLLLAALAAGAATAAAASAAVALCAAALCEAMVVEEEAAAEATAAGHVPIASRARRSF